MSRDYVREWIRKAEADRIASLRAIRDAARRKDQAEIACFHAEQCIEKYLKAILAGNHRNVPRTHDLLALARLTKTFGIPLPQIEPDLRVLNQYAVEIRYPGSSATLSEGKMVVRAMARAIKYIKPILKK